MALGVATVLIGCGGGRATMPGCDAGARLGIVAQSVPEAAYVPCVRELPVGWSFAGVDVSDAGTTIRLESDRADRGVEVELTDSCDVAAATPIAPSDEGARTYQLVESIDPRYRGRFIDVFPGGCVVATYDFARGPHIALVTELQRAIDLYPRRQLRQELHAELGVDLDR